MKDLEWFVRFAQEFNGVQLLPKAPRANWLIECDSTLLAGGTYSLTHFYEVQYPDSIISQHMSIMQLEALNLVHAVKFLLPPNPLQFTIVVNTDNSASQQVLESGKGRDGILQAIVAPD